MVDKIGFLSCFDDKKKKNESVLEQKFILPRKSLVQVSFPGRGSALG